MCVSVCVWFFVVPCEAHTIYGANACGCYGGSGDVRGFLEEIGRVNGAKDASADLCVVDFCSG